MKLNPPGRLLIPAALMLGAIVALASPALAALGGSADSVSADSSAMRGQLRSTSLVQYDMQEITQGAQTVREYVTRSGQVFAVTWQGPVPPDLRQLLGTYFGRFQEAAAASHRTNPGVHRQLNIVQSDLVVQSSGRLRAFRGLAYLPALVPDGVSVDQLQ
ncbi:MAG TPA: DUF2844 domain-containing protein [Steroidobacteraceae bacterium]|jgi:hypothetical protein|nr:DUF2844 domain-containing protein [Steroidobacteraceae bacterium]